MTKLATAHAGPSGSAARDIEMSYHAKLCAALNEQIGDKYEVLRWIGGGGMADVFLARHRVSGGRAAVKLLAERLADNETLVKRFVAERGSTYVFLGTPDESRRTEILRGSLVSKLVRDLPGIDIRVVSDRALREEHER